MYLGSGPRKFFGDGHGHGHHTRTPYPPVSRCPITRHTDPLTRRVGHSARDKVRLTRCVMRARRCSASGAMRHGLWSGNRDAGRQGSGVREEKPRILARCNGLLSDAYDLSISFICCFLIHLSNFDISRKCLSVFLLP